MSDTDIYDGFTMSEREHIDGDRFSGKWATEEELLEFCNQVREAGGGEIINALLPGITENPQTCLIARNLNFSCEVTPHVISVSNPMEEVNIGDPIDGDKIFSPKSKDWVMVIDDENIRFKIARILKLDTVIHRDGGSVVKALRLPRRIGNAADAFDNELDFGSYRVNSLDE